jgi:hypothetical protein
MIPVGWLAPSECWDQLLPKLLTTNKIYPTGLDFRHFQGYPPPHQAEGCIISIPGAYWHDQYDKINEALTRYRWVLGMRVSDECDLFDVSRVIHGNIKWLVQTPRTGRDYGDARLFGVGFTPHFNSLPAEPPDKSTDVYLSGQNTHGRRKECFEALENWHGNKVVRPTEGFTEGFEPREYVAGVVNAKVCPAPSGAVSVDTFRFWEAIAAHCVPIADTVSPVDGLTDYWERVCPGAPFPTIRDYADLPGYIDDQLEQWPANSNRIAAWWMRYKRYLALGLRADLHELGAIKSVA